VSPRRSAAAIRCTRPGGIILVLGVQYAPLVFLTLRAGLRALPQELLEAALAGGAKPLRVVRTIVLPLMTPPLLAGVALCFVSCLGNFGIPALLGIPATTSCCRRSSTSVSPASGPRCCRKSPYFPC
jgi:ABC-type Fe3+ transport system permease subunit